MQLTLSSSLQQNYYQITVVHNYTAITVDRSDTTITSQ